MSGTSLHTQGSEGSAATGMSPEIRASANASHKFRAEQSPRGRHVLALHSGHVVPVTEPGVVADEIRRMLERGASAQTA